MMSEAQSRRRIRAPSERRTMLVDITEMFAAVVRAHSTIRWPSERWRRDPVGFHRDILGIDPWEKQREVLESVRDNPLTTVESGHRVGKSILGAGAGLWFYSSFDDARVVCTAPTGRQVEGILFRDLQKLHRRSGRCLACFREDPKGPRPCPHSAVIDGELGQKAATGLVAEDLREIRGYTAKDVESITGTAGAALFFILDEASGIADAIYEGLDGNRAGWAEDPSIMVRMLLMGNPTKTHGEFYDSHHHPTKKLVYARYSISSRESPNVVAGRVVVPGLATSQWIEQMEAKYGKDSAFVRVRVDGKPPTGEDGKAFSLAMIQLAEERWRDEDCDGVGPLYIGLDPAGESGTGDEACFVPRRRFKQLAIRVFRGLTPEAHGVHLLDVIAEFRTHPRERAIVVMDSEGKVGADVYAHLSSLGERTKKFDLHRVRASDHARREPHVFDRTRDELAHNFGAWLREGGGLIEDSMLEQEMHSIEWDRVSGRAKITPKKTLRKILGRSPDRYDATALSVWEPVDVEERQREDTRDAEEAEDDEDLDAGDGGGIDPYGGGIDPYE